MKPAAFDYLRVETVEEALDGLARFGSDARILAGGQSLIAMLNMRLARPAVLIDIMRLDELATARWEIDAITVPAGVRQATLMSDTRLTTHVPLLAAAMPWIGHFQTRARGTLCGSIAHADPSAEIPLCLLALGGTVHLRTRKRRRTISAGEFFTGLMSTARNDDEMIESVRWPVAKPGAGYAFAEVGRRHGDFAIVACAAIAERSGVRLAVGGVADIPTAIDLPCLDGNALDDALNAFAWSLDARSDFHATGRYRRDLVRQIGRHVITEAIACRT